MLTFYWQIPVLANSTVVTCTDEFRYLQIQPPLLPKSITCKFSAPVSMLQQPERDTALPFSSDCRSICLSVCLCVTLCYCIETNPHSIKLLWPSAIGIILIRIPPPPLQNSNQNTFSVGVNELGWEKLANFHWNRRLSRKWYKIDP